MHEKIVGAVAIGRNEGERLKRCLQSLVRSLSTVVYVDSGSTDESVNVAKALGVQVVELDLSIPFTAARARNAGAKAILSIAPEMKFIQFVDGDCEVQTNWLEEAYQFLDKNPDYAITCGRRRERFPESSPYNALCDIEWDTPIGDVKSCGGDALIRVSAYTSVNGYRNDLIAGEEPEMCFRLRKCGWKISRLDVEMTLHDAAMDSWKQWWKRNVRAGHAYAESNYLHGASSEKFRQKECRSIVLWAAVLPITFIVLSSFSRVYLLLFLFYPLQLIRLIAIYNPILKKSKYARYYALSNLLSKFPQLIGMLHFYVNKFVGKRNVLIEYKK